MYFKQIIDEIGDSLNDTCSKWAGDNSSRVKEAVNEFLFLDFLTLLSWDFLQKDGLVTTVAEYITGTVTVTNGSASVTGSGTTFTSGMVGRRILPSGSNKSYKITGYGSATSLTIESAYEGTTVSGVNYSIAKDRIDLPRWIDDPKRIYRIVDRDNNKVLTQLSRQDMERAYGAKGNVQDPNFYSPAPRVRTSYSTGTVAASSNSSVLTGTSTAWTSSGIEQFDLIRIGNYVYTVSSVDSDTQITLVDLTQETILAGTAYSAVVDRWQVDFYPMPKNLRSYQVVALQLIPRLVNAYDVPILPDNWHYILVKGGRVKMLKHNQDSNYTVEQEELIGILKRFISQNNRENDRTERFSIT